MKKIIALTVMLSVTACLDQPTAVDPNEDAQPSVPTAGAPQQPQRSGARISPTTGVPDAGSQFTVNGAEVALIGAWNVPITIPVGSTVPTITVSVRDNATTCPLCSNWTAFNVMLVAYRADGSWQVLDSVTSSGDGSQQTLTLASTHVVTADDILKIRYYTWSTPAAPTRASVIGDIILDGI